MKPLTIQEFIEEVAILAAQNFIELKGIQFSEKTMSDYNRETDMRTRIVLDISDLTEESLAKHQNDYPGMIQITVLK